MADSLAAPFYVSSLMAIDLVPLWDFSQPELSEYRFRAALTTATPDDALILQTQIARTYGLRRDFAHAQEILKSIEEPVAAASPEARVRHQLELGRTLCSATHAPESQTAAATEQARASYLRALEDAEANQLDALAIDALHMLAFVDTAPEDQLKWGERALKISLASSRPAARQWEASLRNNLGVALHQLQRFNEALAQFQQAVLLRERGGDANSTRVAHWMVGWTLRALNRIDEALAIQLRLERECEAAGVPDPYVFDELEALSRVRGDDIGAQQYAERRRRLTR